MKYTTFSVPSMHSEVSANLIESAINNVSGVKNINTNYETGIVEVLCEGNNTINKVSSKIKSLGYNIN